MLSDYDFDAIHTYLKDFKSYLRQLEQFEKKNGPVKDAVRNPFWMFECSPTKEKKSDSNKKRKFQAILKEYKEKEAQTKSTPETPKTEQEPAKLVQNIGQKKEESPYFVQSVEPYSPPKKEKEEADVVRDIAPFSQPKKEEESPYIVHKTNTLDSYFVKKYDESKDFSFSAEPVYRITITPKAHSIPTPEPTSLNDNNSLFDSLNDEEDRDMSVEDKDLDETRESEGNANLLKELEQMTRDYINKQYASSSGDENSQLSLEKYSDADTSLPERPKDRYDEAYYAAREQKRGQRAKQIKY